MCRHLVLIDAVPLLSDLQTSISYGRLLSDEKFKILYGRLFSVGLGPAALRRFWPRFASKRVKVTYFCAPSDKECSLNNPPINLEASRGPYVSPAGNPWQPGGSTFCRMVGALRHPLSADTSQTSTERRVIDCLPTNSNVVKSCFQ